MIVLCGCGCGIPVKKKGSRFTTGHAARLQVLSEEHKRKIGLANSLPKIELICAECKKSFLVKPSRVREGAKYCSRECMGVASRGKNDSTRISRSISAGVRRMARGGKGFRKWQSFVGWNIDEFKKHIEPQFTDDMSWETYGKTWSIDHIIPVSAFNIVSIECIDFRLCWSLSNLRPLCPKENSRKRNKLSEPFQPSLGF